MTLITTASPSPTRSAPSGPVIRLDALPKDSGSTRAALYATTAYALTALVFARRDITD